MNKTKITNHQLFSLTATGGIGGSLLVIAALIASIAKQDAWLTSFVTLAFGIPVIWIYWFLGNRYPNMTFIGIIKEILGKWIGLIFAVGFVTLCLLMICILPWFMGNFITTLAMPETPTYVINLLLLISIVIAMLYGIEVIARVSEIFIYFSSILLFITIILVAPNARIENLQPMLEKGILPILKSSIILSSYITFPIIILMMIYPINVSNTFKAKKSLFIGYIWGVFLVFITITITVLVLGSEFTAKSQYPTFTLAKEINVGGILSRLEVIIAGSWIATQFMISVLFFYAGTKGLSELLGLKDHRKIVIPIGLVGSVMSIVVYPNVVYQANWSSMVWPPYIITFGFVLPALLLVVYFVKKWLKISNKSQPH